MATVSRGFFRVNISADLRQAKAFYKDLSDKGLKRAASNALNAVARTVRNESRNEVAKLRRIGKREVNSLVKLGRRAAVWSLTAEVVGSGVDLSLKRFKPRQNARGVSVNVKGKRKTIKHAFGPGFGGTKKIKAQLPVMGGHVYQRKYKHRRLPVLKRFGPRISSAFASKLVRQHQDRVIVRDWKKTFDTKCREQIINAELRAAKRAAA